MLALRDLLIQGRLRAYAELAGRRRDEWVKSGLDVRAELSVWQNLTADREKLFGRDTLERDVHFEPAKVPLWHAKVNCCSACCIAGPFQLVDTPVGRLRWLVRRMSPFASAAVASRGVSSTPLVFARARPSATLTSRLGVSPLIAGETDGKPPHEGEQAGQLIVPMAVLHWSESKTLWPFCSGAARSL